jgi:hypothetical protein
MVYSGLYRCSGCSVTFADPTAWREASAAAVAAKPVTPDSATRMPTTHLPTGGPNFATWGGGGSASRHGLVADDFHSDDSLS